jgi:hypothetical protein
VSFAIYLDTHRYRKSCGGEFEKASEQLPTELRKYGVLLLDFSNSAKLDGFVKSLQNAFFKRL